MKVLIAVALLTGCSFTIGERVADGWQPRDGEPRCTGSRGLLLLDVAGAVAGAITAIAAGLEVQPDAPVGSRDAPPMDNTMLGVAIAGGIAALAHGTSAALTFSDADECREARRRRDLYLDGAMTRLGGGSATP